MTMPTSDPTPPRPDDAPLAAAAPAPDSAREVGWARAAAVLSLALGVIAALQLILRPFRDISGAVELATVGAVAVVVGLLARHWSRRARRRTSAMAIAGIWMGAVGAVLGFIPAVLITVLAEAPAPEPTLTPSESAVALESEQRKLDEVAARAATRLMWPLERDDAAGDDGPGPYPFRLAVTTDGDLLLTPDGELLAELPYDTDVRYETWADSTHFRLLLFGPLGARSEVTDTEPTPTPTPEPTPSG